MSLEDRIAALEARVAHLETERSGRKPLPIVVSKDGVCGVDPDSDSSDCPYASLYRRQKGCKGIACKAKSSEYWTGYRKTAAAKVAPRKRRK